jgi:uncharacterized protein (DUF1330 family)
MTTLAARHSVADYDTWKAVFDEHASIRRDHGATGHRVLRDGNDLLVLVEFPDAEAARSFVTDPSLLAAQRIGGVQGTPDGGVYVEAEQVRY